LCLVTNDGGATWAHHSLNSTSNRVVKGHFINAQEGFVAGRGSGGNSGMFMKTTDGGYTWGGVSLFNERAFNVYFLNAMTGWVMGKNGLLQKTTDGGLSWTPQTVTNEDALCMRFFDASTGLLGCGGGELYLTSDGGSTWSSVNSGTGDNLTAISMVGTDAWICGEGGAILHSSNSGQSWNVQSTTVPVDFADVSFSDVNNGWLGGISGVVSNSTDGGNTWSAQSGITNHDVLAIEMRNPALGWLMDSNADLYKFSSPAGVAGMNAAEAWKIYPNPARGAVSIHLAESRLYQIILRDEMGREVLSQRVDGAGQTGEITLSLNDVPAGCYFIQLETSEGRSGKAVMVE
ncbi:MAG: T9SS type A sorting domain-containing protein, partial [Bacteroidia bacterium]|nr:T9SS type A sorting domain-containing protein [Bacteroidia bacterium]